jgi:phosphonate transport system permease protein
MFATRTGRPPAGAIAALGIAAVLAATAPLLRIDPSKWLPGALLQTLAWPDADGLRELSARFLETIEMAVAGTALAVLVCIPLSFAAAGNLAPAWISAPIKLALAALRAVPDLVWALILASAVGVGQLAGLAALFITSVAFLGKAFAESLEVVPVGPLEALRAAGAGPAAVRRIGALEQARSDFVGLAFYQSDTSVRAASILGLVGAGGIGMELKLAMDFLNYERLGFLILAIWAAVAAIDGLAGIVRWRMAR